ncbi:MAG: tRNA dihydrouridine(16) synthase DusC, partial [Polaromonas sp.]|nr:tRNA dihydrouridine(16) synthase DusC [Polaromonas sp.]
SWPTLLPLIAEFWHIVCSRLDARARAGRLKQWLNFLRRRFPEAEVAYQAIKTINDPVVVDEWLTRLLQANEGARLPTPSSPVAMPALV